MKISALRLAIVFLYCLAVLYGTGYMVFYKDASGWWFLLAACFMPSLEFILKVAQEESEE